MQISYLNSNLFLFRSYLLDGRKQRLLLWRWPGGEENIRRGGISFFWERGKTELEEEENIWKCQGYWEFSVSVSVSTLFRRIWSWEKSLGIGFGKFRLGKKVSVLENLVSEKKYWFWFRKIWYHFATKWDNFLTAWLPGCHNMYNLVVSKESESAISSEIVIIFIGPRPDHSLP